MLIYAFRSALTLALLYTGFLVLLSREPLHRLNRLLLLFCLVASLVLPLIHVTVDHPLSLLMMNRENETVVEMQLADGLPMTEYDVNEVHPATTPTEVAASEISWTDWIHHIYIIGMLMTLIVLLVRTVSLLRLLHGGLRHTDAQGNTVILKRGQLPPFSIFSYIVMSVSDYEQHRHTILVHEQEHIRLRHTLDILLVEAVRVVQWFNPFVYLLGRDLQEVHEYEADEAVINQGIDAKQYQQLLVMKAVGSRLQPFANNLRHGSLKQRINMMQRKKSPRWHALRAVFIIPATALAVYAFASPASGNAEAVSQQQTEYVRIDLRGAVLPVSSTVVTNGFVQHSGYPHNGLDIKLNTGDAVCSAFDGTVVTVNYEPKSYGKYVVLRHPNGLETLYAHLSEQSVTVSQNVRAGETIGLGGNTGRSTGAHLHFETRLGGTPIDPALMFDFKNQKVVGDYYTYQAAVANAEPIFNTCEQMPKFEGGDAALMQFIAQNMKYPQQSIDQNVQGRMIVKFVVEKDGTISHPCIEDESGETLDDLITVFAKKYGTSDSPERTKFEQEIAATKALQDEALRVVRLTDGRWTPGRQRGQTVRSWYTLPVVLHLN